MCLYSLNTKYSTERMIYLGEPLSFEEMCSSENICDYCINTNYGENKCVVTPSGPIMCEGRWCDDAYETYLEEFDSEVY